jgi:hypothetical protein
LLGSPAPATPNTIIQVLLALAKDRLTRIKFGMLYVKPKIRPSKAMDNDYSFKMECHCAVSLSLKEWLGSQKRKKKKKKRRNKKVGQNINH